MNDTQTAPAITTAPPDATRRTGYKVVGWITAVAILGIVGMLQASPTWPAAAAAFAIATMVVIVCGCVIGKK